MFHAWDSTQTDQGETNAHGSGRRRTSTSRACEPCRKRKIRCNGEMPCETCLWYRKASSCHYTEPRLKPGLSKRSAEKMTESLQEYRGIVQKLFPAMLPEQLTALSREGLIELLSKESPMQQPLSPITPGENPRAPNPEAANFEQLLPMPEDDTDGAESRLSEIQGITDDVNALSLSVKRSSSYLGISSVMAALRVILWLDPEAQNFFKDTPDMSHVVGRETSSPPEAPTLERITPRTSEASSPVWDEIPHINAYFNYIHPFVPLIDEQYFRDTYMMQKRKDSRWLLLLNTVLALGAMAAASSCEDRGHHLYWIRVKQHLTIETLGSVHIETVQALALLGGWYLHYINKPHVANNLMGATLRLATALGLHRDYSEGMGSTKTVGKATHSIELRRRVWWNLFIMDAWHGSSLGRPSMGRMSDAISAKPPQEPIGKVPLLLSIVQENIRFCMISTRMEDALAISPLIPEAERLALDNAFVDWFNASSVKNKTPRGPLREPAGVTISKNVMRWRYLLWRIIIHRPVLLWYAMRRMPFDKLSADKKSAIELCRDLAAELIDDIATTWQGQEVCQMAGWNATWNLYQTLMVPLLSLFSDPSDHAVVEKSRAQVEQGLAALSDLRDWSNIARRSYQVVHRIYVASKRHDAASATTSTVEQHAYISGFAGNPTNTSLTDATAATAGGDIGPAQFDAMFANLHWNTQDVLSTPGDEMLVDDMFDSLNWNTSWGEGVYPFESTAGHPTGWDYGTVQGWDGGVGVEFDNNHHQTTVSDSLFMQGIGSMGVNLNATNHEGKGSGSGTSS